MVSRRKSNGGGSSSAVTPTKASSPSSPSPSSSSSAPSPSSSGGLLDARTLLGKYTALKHAALSRSHSSASATSTTASKLSLSRTDSLVSYATTTTLDGSSSSCAGGSDLDDDEPAAPPRRLSAHPPPSKVSSTRAPDRTFDVDPDFVPSALDPYSLRHAEFGFDPSDPRKPNLYRAVSAWDPSDHVLDRPHEEVEPTVLVYLLTYIAYAVLILIGHARDFVGKRVHPKAYAHLRPHAGYAALFSDFDSFYTRRLKLRIDDCFARPVTQVAARTATLLDRTTRDHNRSFLYTGTTTQALNVSSYNYLGFAQTRGACADLAERVVRSYGVSSPGTRADVAGNDLHVAAERLVARFMGVDDAVVVSQGFATNSTVLPALVSKGCLIISDELNHSSIRFGARVSGAMVRSYKHNDMRDLEQLVRECISQGQPRTHRPWKKIVVVLEGLFSMEGTIVPLPRVLELKDKYKFYLYVDEAHSIGAMGPRGRGVCDYFSVDPRRVDVLMGTFTKSFGAAGGYISGSHALVNSLRSRIHAHMYAEAIAPPVVAQVIASMASIMGPDALPLVPRALFANANASSAEGPPLGQVDDAVTGSANVVFDGRDGRERLRRLAWNCRYLREGLRRLGFIVYGHRDSPIIPMLIFEPGKMPVFSRLMLERYKIVVVVVAYPATPLVSSRVRFCLSAAHTKEDIDVILRATDEIGGALGLRLAPRASSRPHGVAAHSTHDDDLGWFGLARRGGRMSIDEVIAHAEDIADGRI